MMESLRRGTGDKLPYYVYNQTDPLTKVVAIVDVANYNKQQKYSIQSIIHGFAEANECVAFSIKFPKVRVRRGITIELKLKRRVNFSNQSPFEE